MATKSQILIVGEEAAVPLAERLKEKGVEPVLVNECIGAAALVDHAEKEGAAIEAAFISTELENSQLEWLVAYIKGKEAFKVSRVIVLDTDKSSKVKYWLQLGANSCVGTSPDELHMTADYWASLLKTKRYMS